MTVSAGFLLAIHPSLGGASLIPAIFILIFVKLINPWVRKKNAISTTMFGLLSGEAQEGLSNFKTIIAFDRREFFRNNFKKANRNNFRTSVVSGLANGIFSPVFTLFGDLAQLIVLTYGIYLITQGEFTIGLLISYIAYVQNFYRPLRQMATLWASFQSTMASWDRIAVVLNLESDLEYGNGEQMYATGDHSLIAFRNVSFQYQKEKKILENINIELHKGKTYSLRRHTGGGKTTTRPLSRVFTTPMKEKSS